MANEHIGRKQAIGLGKESTSGTSVAVGTWIPKMSGTFKPVFEKTVDDSAYGVIDEIYDSVVAKNMTEVEVEGIARDEYIGDFLLAALGTADKCDIITITGESGGTPARGDVVSSVTDSWAGVLKKLFTVSATTYYAVSTTSGTLTSSGTDLTNGTWTGGTWAILSGVTGHFFSRLNTNSHPSYTIYGSDPIGDDLASYCMLDTLDLEASVGEFMKINAKFMGKKIESASSQSPSYTAETAFLAKYANVYFGDAESDLNGATAVDLQRFKVSIAKNLMDIQNFGSVDVDSFHNQQFNVSGDMEAIYNSNTLRDYVADSTKKACRLAVINTDATALSGAIYPSVYIDIARASFEEWDRSGDNNAIVTQTLGYSAEFDVSTAMSVEVLLLNGRSTAY